MARDNRVRVNVSYNTAPNGNRYYTIIINEIEYHFDIHFPLEWALEYNLQYEFVYGNTVESVLSGPSNCDNCACYGSYNGVFVCYCLNCADILFNGERGNAISVNSLGEPFINIDELPYMEGVEIEEIGFENQTNE
jgi:hypothetical protein